MQYVSKCYAKVIHMSTCRGPTVKLTKYSFYRLTDLRYILRQQSIVIHKRVNPNCKWPISSESGCRRALIV